MDLLVDLIAALALAGSCFGLVFGLGMSVFRRSRRRGKKVFFGSLVTFFVAVFSINAMVERDARLAGFDSAAEQDRAEKAGIQDAAARRKYKNESAARMSVPVKPPEDGTQQDTGPTSADPIASALPDQPPIGSLPKTALISPAGTPPSRLSQEAPGQAGPSVESEPRSGQEIETRGGSGTSPKIYYIKGTRVAFRAGPGTNHPVLDRFNMGRALEFLGEDGNGWSHFRDQRTRREGWVATFLTHPEETGTQASHQKEQSEPQPTQTAPVQPVLSRAAIIKAIIADSRAGYYGSCPCPYNRDRAGRKCGRRSAWSKPGGASPICYPADVTPEMIANYREQDQ